jgi:shikimate dehydrogenase
LAFNEASIIHAQLIFDVVALPSHTPLLTYAKKLGKTIISVSEVFVIQAFEQFALHTHI